LRKDKKYPEKIEQSLIFVQHFEENVACPLFCNDAEEIVKMSNVKI
jgi:hypothetical protein